MLQPIPIRHLLVANRGEIAIRILQAAQELPDPPITYALYTSNDATHVSLGRPDHAIQIPSASSYMDIDFLLDVMQKYQIDAIHPGYGFLSESADFARRVLELNSGGLVHQVIGPGWEVLQQTGDKLAAKALAQQCGVPVLQALTTPTNTIEPLQQFTGKHGFPIMIKAVDGGGGRGIRLVPDDRSLKAAMERCIGESSSGFVFAEQAAINGYKHIEVQILGDGTGRVRHFWERDCSAQRRFQKIVEIAPTPVVTSRAVIERVIQAAVRMASTIKYKGLGTFEFLVNIKEETFFFLEINPRLQVEHTVTESICGIDLVREQLLVARGASGMKFRTISDNDDHHEEIPPRMFSIQLRLCAEDPNSGFNLSIGKVSDVRFPTGNGVRVDSHLSKGGVVGSDFDNLMAKIIVTAGTWEEVLSKARRALEATSITGVKTNLNLLRAIVSDEEFQSGLVDTQWLEKNIDRLVHAGNSIGEMIEKKTASLPILSTGLEGTQTASGGHNNNNAVTSFRKRDAWSLRLQPVQAAPSATASPAHHLRIDKIARNEFPSAFTADVSYTLPGQKSQPFRIALTATTSSADATSSTHRRGDPDCKSHIVLPMSGKLIEVLVEEGDVVEENQVVAFVKQMKMELEVRSSRRGVAKWVIEMEDEDAGDDVAEGVLLVELEVEEEASSSNMKSRL